MGKTVQGTAADGHAFSIYRAEPAGTPCGALVIVQEIFGVNSHIRAVCDDYAAEGYVAVAPALFDRVERGIELGYQADDIAAGRAIREKAAASEATGAGRIGVVGYCWGGTVAWVAATRSRTFAAAVSYYGGGVPDLADEQPNCPVQLHFGEMDASIPVADVEAIRAARPEIEIYVYNGAGHGFGCDERDGYSAPDAALARRRTLEFFALHLG